MRSSLAALTVAAALAAAPGSAQQVIDHEAVAGMPTPDPSAQTHDVSMRGDGHDRLTVPVMIAGAGPYRFLVDTGADRTAISDHLARRLQLPAGRSARMHSVTGADTVRTARVPLLELSGRRVELIDAPILQQRHMGADGILGVDSLRSQRLLFDFTQNRLSIIPTETKAFAIGPDTIVVRARARRGHLILTHAKANKHKVSVVVDTGAQVSIGNEALRKRLGIRFPPESEGVPVLSVTGDVITGHVAVINTLDIGGVTLRRLPVVFANAHTFRKLDLEDQPTLLLGMNAMKAFEKVSIDFAQKKIRVVLPETSSLSPAALAGSALSGSPARPVAGGW